MAKGRELPTVITALDADNQVNIRQFADPMPIPGTQYPFGVVALNGLGTRALAHAHAKLPCFARCGREEELNVMAGKRNPAGENTIKPTVFCALRLRWAMLDQSG